MTNVALFTAAIIASAIHSTTPVTVVDVKLPEVPVAELNGIPESPEQYYQRNFAAALETFVSDLQEFVFGPNDAEFTNERTQIRLDDGKRYIRVVRIKIHQLSGQECSTSSYCFIDKTNGNILKSASWKAPAKHARGCIFGPNPTKCCGPYGVASLR